MNNKRIIADWLVGRQYVGMSPHSSTVTRFTIVEISHFSERYNDYVMKVVNGLGNDYYTVGHILSEMETFIQ